MTLKLNGTNSVAAPAYAGADADTGLQCGTNELKLVTGGTARATADSSGRLLVGASSSSANTSLVLQGNSALSTGTGTITLARGSSTPSNGAALGEIDFSDTSHNTPAAWIYAARDGGTWTSGSSQPSALVFSTTADGASSPTERMRILSSGGLTFNGDTAQANALEDYEEGTWTPAITNTGYTYTYTTQEGQYTKIGRLVTLRFRIVISARSGSASGGGAVINLPITPDGTMDGAPYHTAMPSELIVHKVGTTTSNGAKTLLFGGLANSNTSYFWVNNPTVATSAPFDLGSDFNLGGVITYTA